MLAPPSSSSRRRILVVEDDDLLRRSLARLFGERAEVLLAEGPDRARELLAGGEVDIIVSDHAMGGETGLSFLLGVGEASPSIELVLFSALPPAEAYDALGEGLLDAVFRKPDDLDALVDFVLRPASSEAPVEAPLAAPAGPGCELDASEMPVVRLRVRRRPTDDEWAEQARAASTLLATGAAHAVVLEVAAGASLTPAQHEALAAWQRHHREMLASLCLGVALVGTSRALPSAARHARPLGIPVRVCASPDAALAWARERLAARPGGA